MHDQREVLGQGFLDLFEHVEVQPLLAGKLERAVRGADGHRQRIAAALLDEFGRLGRIGQPHAADDVLLDAAELPELGLDHDPLGIGAIGHAAGDRVFLANSSCEASIITEL